MTNLDISIPRAGHAGGPDVDGTPVGGRPVRRADEEAAVHAVAQPRRRRAARERGH